MGEPAGAFNVSCVLSRPEDLWVKLIMEPEDCSECSETFADRKNCAEVPCCITPYRSGSKLTWTLELIPEQAKNNFNHWVGLQVHKGRSCRGISKASHL